MTARTNGDALLANPPILARARVGVASVAGGTAPQLRRSMEKGQGTPTRVASVGTLVLPPALEPGSVIAVVAPASPFEREEVLRGLAWLRMRHRLKLRARIFERQGYLAGSDDARADELAAAMVDDEVQAILAA